LHEALLVPFHLSDRAAGTVWVIKDDSAYASDAHFDVEDVRVLKSLARFASAAYQMVDALQRAQASEAESKQRQVRATADRQAARAALAVQTRFLEATLSSIPDPVYAFDSNGNFAYANHALLVLLGLSADELVGRNFLELGYTPELARRLNGHIQHILDTGATIEDEIFFTSPSGVSGFFELVWGPVQAEDGTIALIVGTSRDTTERRHLERRLQVLMEGIPQLVWRAIGEGHWTWCSPQWTRYTGQSEQQSAGHGWLDALHSEDREAAMQCWREAPGSGQLRMEKRIRNATEGTYRWFQTHATPVRDESGTILEWLGTCTDIHDLRELQDRQKILVAELQHRTRNLIGVVRSMADKTMQRAANVSEFRDSFGLRLEALARVQGLLSRLELDDRVTFDKLIQAELTAHGLLNGASDRITLDGPEGVRLRSNTVQTLAMAMHELATNASKYGALAQPGGHLHIRWHVSGSYPDTPRLAIEWLETGISMPLAGAAPRGGGQGRELIERALPYQLEAKTHYELRADGVLCTIDIPISSTVVGPEHA
jgi:PAS domain S-box-containing protein